MSILKISARSAGVVVVGALCLLALFPLVGHTESDPMIGTWRLNVEASKFIPGPAPRNGILTIEKAGQGLKVRSRGVDAAQRPTGILYVANFDGKDYPFTGSDDYQMVALRRIDANTIEQTRKRAGQGVATATYSIGQNGQVLTITIKGTNAKGQRLDIVAVLDRTSSSST